MPKQLPVSADAPWKQYFRLARIAHSALANLNPDRGLVTAQIQGHVQLHAWDVPSASLRPLTTASQGIISARGDIIYSPQILDEQGGVHLVRMPFAGGQAEDLSPALPPYQTYYFTESYIGNAFSFQAIFEDTYYIYVLSTADLKPLLSYENPAFTIGATLSHDGHIAVLATVEKSQNFEFALEAYDLRTGQLLGELWQGEGAAISPIGFIPQAGEERFLALSKHTGLERPLIWHPRTGQIQEILLPELAESVMLWDCSRDGRYLLLGQLWQAQYQFYRYDLQNAQLEAIKHPHGSYQEAYFHPSRASVIALRSTATEPSQLIELPLDDKAPQTLLTLDAALPSRAWESMRFPSEDGTEIQAWLAVPEGQAPFPTIIHLHGGPSAVQTEQFEAESQAWLAQGFAFCSINYRGSTSFGRDFAESIKGRVGELEVQDIGAGVKWLIAEGIAQRGQIFAFGRSYGGYLVLQALSRQPELWAGGIAVDAIADWRLFDAELAPLLRAYGRDLFGGSPVTLPEAYQVASPLHYVADLAAPVLILQAENDPRCPARQMQAYLAALEAHEKTFEIHWYDASTAFTIERQVEHQERAFHFVYQVLGQQ